MRYLMNRFCAVVISAFVKKCIEPFGNTKLFKQLSLQAYFNEAPSGKVPTTTPFKGYLRSFFFRLFGGTGKLVTPDGAQAYQA